MAIASYKLMALNNIYTPMAPKCPSSTPDIFRIQMYFSNTMKIPDFVFFPWYLFLIAIKRNSTILSDKKEKKEKKFHNRPDI